MKSPAQESAIGLPVLEEIRSRNGLSRLSDFDLMQTRIGKRALMSRMIQPALILLNLFVFTVLMLAGIFGNPIGNQNGAIIMIWIFWFFLLIALLTPVGGRAWCLMCPLPAPAEWLSRLAIVRKNGRIFPNLGLKWPKTLDNIWLQNFGFLGVATFSPIILTRPPATSYLLLFFVFLAIVLSVMFKKQAKIGRIFCRYVCPVGGFIGLYSLMGALEVKVRDLGVCKKCTYKNCVKGNENGWGCPWYEYPGSMDRNLYCGLCTECLKTCAYDNVAFKTRPFALDLTKKRKMDEAYKSFIMLGSCLMFLVVFFGWWGSWKEVADPIDGVFLQGPVNWANLAVYAGALWATALVVIPGIHLGTVWLARAMAGARKLSLKKLFVDYAYALVPLGLLAWIGFVLGMLMVNGSYIVPVISDPFGWGWDLFGTRDYAWRPYFPEAVPYIQIVLLVVGLIATTAVGYRISLENFPERRQALQASIPLVAFFIVVASAFALLFVML
ncbi:MAG: 4Fe-4S binding protein [Dehalococcoidia bacterium]